MLADDTAQDMKHFFNQNILVFLFLLFYFEKYVVGTH